MKSRITNAYALIGLQGLFKKQEVNWYLSNEERIYATMIFVSITRLRLRSFIYLPAFFWHTTKSGKQLVKDSTFNKGKTLLDKGLVFWTMTLWNNEADMRDYRNTDAHKKAMPKLQHWCNEASLVHWQQEKEEFPSWAEAHKRMQ